MIAIGDSCDLVALGPCEIAEASGLKADFDEVQSWLQELNEDQAKNANPGLLPIVSMVINGDLPPGDLGRGLSSRLHLRLSLKTALKSAIKQKDKGFRQLRLDFKVELDRVRHRLDRMDAILES